MGWALARANPVSGVLGALAEELLVAVFGVFDVLLDESIMSVPAELGAAVSVKLPFSGPSTARSYPWFVNTVASDRSVTVPVSVAT
jgi:hypothetical protein